MIQLLNNDDKFKQIEQTVIPKCFPNMAYIMVNLRENIGSNGVIYPDIGDLYAVADADGLEQLLEVARGLVEFGNNTLVNVLPLENELGVLE